MKSITVYSFDRVNGAYSGEADALESPLESEGYLDPAFTSRDRPPSFEAGFVPIRNVSRWAVVPDHRGELWYGEAGNMVTIDKPGVPVGLSKYTPPDSAENGTFQNRHLHPHDR